MIICLSSIILNITGGGGSQGLDLYKYDYQSNQLSDHYEDIRYTYEGDGIAYLQYVRLSTNNVITVNIDDELCFKISKGSYGSSSKVTLFTPIAITDSKYLYLNEYAKVSSIAFANASQESEIRFGHSSNYNPMNDVYYAIDYPLRFKKNLEISFTNVTDLNVVSLYIKVYYIPA